MTEQEFWLESDGVQLFVRKWLPDTPVRAVINIVHGMVEHSGRYRALAGALCEKGIAVWCADQRGHGKTANLEINNEHEGGLIGHCADTKAFRKILADIDLVIRTIIKNHKNTPVIILGHSWGSFLTQGYIEFYGGKLSGAILSGTKGPGGADVQLGAPFLALIARLRGVRGKSLFVHKLVFGSAYQKPFMPCRTPHDWISRDENAVDAYNADPLCGNLPTTGFYRDLLSTLTVIHKIRNIEKISHSLPLYILGGDRDPVGGMGLSVASLVKKYTSIGIKDVSFVLYPGARHECFNEINRDEVIRNLLAWIEARL